METLLGHWIEELHKKAPDSIGDLLRFQVGPCRVEAGEYSFYVATGEWMRNAFGSLHGGIIGTIMDQGMGMLATCLMDGKALTPSVQLNITYHRPLMPQGRILLKVYVESVTKTLIHLRAEAADAARPEKRCVTATGIFFIKRLEPSSVTTMEDPFGEQHRRL